MNYGFLPHWADVLPRDAGHVIAVTGAGGKSEWIAAAAAVMDPAAPVLVCGPDAADDAVDRLVLTELDPGRGGHVRPPVLPPDPWPRRTSLAVVVQSLAPLGRPAREILPGAADDPWTWDDAFAALGLELARVPAGVPVLAALLQLDACDDGIGLFAYLDRVMGEGAVPVVVLGDTSGPRPRLRTAYRDDGDPERIT
ncbi:MAG TPA: hypothetical protein P5571_09950 [Candidatus Krumholzibacteria bacterium]|nr:hypothetical protein [Candidatus Krumholzibacteria bacterium]HRX51676.1 hypothetical protein [Candidatus Krumholzibacteria bacterium]